VGDRHRVHSLSQPGASIEQARGRTTCELPGGELLAAADRLEVTALG